MKINPQLITKVLVGLTVFLGAIQVIASALIINFAPYWQVVQIYFYVTGAFCIAFLALVAAFAHSTRTVSSGNLVVVEDFPSTPKPSRKINRTCMIGISVLLFAVFVSFLSSLSFIFPEQFRSSSSLRVVRLAGASDIHVSIFVRDVSSNSNLTRVCKYRDKNLGGAFIDRPFVLSSQLDFTAFVKLEPLLPSTVYEVQYGETVLEVTTFPPSGSSNQFSFYFGSCFLANFPNYGRDNLGWKHMDNLLADRSAWQHKFVLFMGDFIYTDHPWYKGNSIDVFNSHYRQTLSAPGIEQTLARYPSFFTFDDHEVFDNFDGGVNDTLYSQGAMQTWQAYLGGGNPMSGTKNYYSFDMGQVSYFVLDTRSYRARNMGLPAEDPTKSMLGSTQKTALLDWLLNTPAVFKFLVSSVPWTVAEESSSNDAWHGFLYERQTIFDFIRFHNISGCVFLSADTHMVFGRVELDYPGSNLFEFSSSPLGAFTGFGNPWKSASETNETVAFWSRGSGTSGTMTNLLGIIDVDTAASMPYMNISFYEKEKLIHRDQLALSDLIPK